MERDIENVFIDTEFNSNNGLLELISIALVKENGSNIYLACSEFTENQCNTFVKNTVLPLLKDKPRISKEQIRLEVENFLPYTFNKKYRFWAWFGAYDWVLFNSLWSEWKDIPYHIPFHYHDWRVKLEELYVKNTNAWNFSPTYFDIPGMKKHDALHDALSLREAYMAAEKEGILNENSR